MQTGTSFAALHPASVNRQALVPLVRGVPIREVQAVGILASAALVQPQRRTLARMGRCQGWMQMD